MTEPINAKMIAFHFYLCTENVSQCDAKITIHIEYILKLVLPCVGPQGRGNWEMRGSGPSPGHTLFPLLDGVGVGD